MGLLTDLPSQFREDLEIPNNAKDTISTSSADEKSQAPTPQLIPYKAKISADISTSPINGLKQITPWKIEYNSKNGLPKSH